MHTVTAHAAPPATDARTPATIERSFAADEPSHIHLSRPSRALRTTAAPTPTEETGR